ncbi:Leucine-, isoleucine-, valine-, threonine-, and alanine-binding protein [Collimonas fungivorans Ter331]|uniref:Leucine-, isoleucine-, valine-, threonine-, and alanine-binding protein n=2 Tax=Collimonas fungivorans TaxID=158899 RepID=G0AER8_COLFT|nr:Leucine-, isoleucine-, valine-, threonine-, and alanine-binding protein [Collimonas fungivorans Ter331]
MIIRLLRLMNSLYVDLSIFPRALDYAISNVSNAYSINDIGSNNMKNRNKKTMMGRRQAIKIGSAAMVAGILPQLSWAQRASPAAGNPIRIGFCTDLSGPYQEVDGPAGAEAIRMAIEDMGETVAGRRVELVLGDHQNDPQRAAAIARQWCAHDGVDMLISGVNSDTSLAMTAIAAEHGKLVFVVGAGTSVQTRERANPAIIQYAYDTGALATVPGVLLTHQGLRRWFYVTADYPFGRELQEHGSAAVRAAGGIVVGTAINPHDADDFVPYLKLALDSDAQVIGLANGHAELLKAMAAVDTLGLAQRMKLVGLLTFIDDIHHMGLAKAQGLYLADSWFWTRDADTRRWAERFFARRQRMPSSLHAADYSAALQYLKAVAATGTTDLGNVLTHLRRVSFDDMYIKKGRLREDGVLLHDMHLLRVKAPAQSSSEWDYYESIATLAGEDAFQRR